MYQPAIVKIKDLKQERADGPWDAESEADTIGFGQITQGQQEALSFFCLRTKISASRWYYSSSRFKKDIKSHSVQAGFLQRHRGTVGK